MKTIREFKEESKLIEVAYNYNDSCVSTLYDISDNNTINEGNDCMFGVGDSIAEYINKKQRIADRYFEGSDIIGAACFDKNDHRLDMEYDELSEIVISASHKSAYYAGYSVGFQSAIDLILRHSGIDEDFLKKSIEEKSGYKESDFIVEDETLSIYEFIKDIGNEID